MAWSISITAEGWQEIRDELEQWDREALIAAICDDTFEMVLEKGGQHHAERAVASERERLEEVPQDVLVDQALALIEANDTCDNGGWAYWIDREGYHKVFLPDEEDE